jgi:chromosome segregation ATPase
MGNESLRSELNNLERKVKLLLSDHSMMQTEIALLRKENENLKSKLDLNSEHLTNFQNQAKISKIVESMIVEERGASELKEVIEDYIREIDKCIAHLGEA